MRAPDHSLGRFVEHARYGAAERDFLADVIPRIRVVCAKWNNENREQEAGQQLRDQWGPTNTTTMPHGFVPLSSNEICRVRNLRGRCLRSLISLDQSTADSRVRVRLNGQ